MKKIIITGSAPYLPKWWEENKDKLFEYEVYSINMSVLITKNVCKRWWYSEDFFILHPEIDISIVPPEATNWKWYPLPFEYNKGNTSGTMLFNVLRDLYNENLILNDIEEVNVIGCDLIYKNSLKSHFYENGTPDPMRLGIPLLRENIELFKLIYKESNIKLYNLSTQKESLLTFERRIL
jgi:hypothetical protein